MNCVASTYNASGKLVGCTEQDLSSIIAVQMYTMFALGTGLYLYKTFTAENWVDIAITIGWGCVSTFTHTKRAFVKYVLPSVNVGVSALSDACAKIFVSDDVDDSTVSDDDYSIRVVKDGNETTVYSSVFSFVKDLDENFTEPSCPRRNRTDSDVDADVINVQLSEATTQSQSIKEKSSDDEVKVKDNENNEDNEDNEDNDNQSDQESDDDISETIKRIENHTMQFDFILSEVPTAQTLATASKEGVHVMKYDGFPRDSAGIHFYDRKFAPVNHRMMEVVMMCDGKEYDLDLSSPDNFYVAGNKLLDPAFLKWFMLKNHGVKMSSVNGSDGTKYNYIIKCLDDTATLHTLHPHNYLYVSVTGFEVQDSGLV